FLGREYQAMQGRGSAHSSAMGATEDAAARRVIAGQGPGERCRLHHQLLARSEQVRARSDGGAKGVERLVAVDSPAERLELRDRGRAAVAMEAGRRQHERGRV